jgi:hypothetical protein
MGVMGDEFKVRAGVRRGHVEGCGDTFDWQAGAAGDFLREHVVHLAAAVIERAVAFAHALPHGITRRIHEQRTAPHAPEEFSQRADVAGEVTCGVEFRLRQRSEARHLLPQPEDKAQGQRDDRHPAMLPEKSEETA